MGRKGTAWKQCNNSTIPTFEPSYRSAIDELRVPKVWSWKVRWASTTLPLVICRADGRKHPDFVAEKVFFDRNIPIFTLNVLGPIFTWEAETWCALLKYTDLEAQKVWVWSESIPKVFFCFAQTNSTAPCTPALAHASSLDTDLTRNTRAPHFTPQHWLLCHMELY